MSPKAVICGMDAVVLSMPSPRAFCPCPGCGENPTFRKFKSRLQSFKLSNRNGPSCDEAQPQGDRRTKFFSRRSKFFSRGMFDRIRTCAGAQVEFEFATQEHISDLNSQPLIQILLSEPYAPAPAFLSQTLI